MSNLAYCRAKQMVAQEVEIWCLSPDSKDANIRLYRLQKRSVLGRSKQYQDALKPSSAQSILHDNSRAPDKVNHEPLKIVPPLKISTGKRVFRQVASVGHFNQGSDSSQRFQTSYTCMSSDLNAMLTARSLEGPKRCVRRPTHEC